MYKILKIIFKNFYFWKKYFYTKQKLVHHKKGIQNIVMNTLKQYLKSLYLENSTSVPSKMF